MGDSVAARLARADARLGKGDLAGAGAELAALAGPAAEAAKPWLDRARRRLAVDAAAEKLDAAALAALAGGAQP